ncbi:MAG: ABC transporter ATP-binding protein [bacterium]
MRTDTEFAISVKSLSKYYGDFLAVDDISFSVKPGEFFGFLGPNGAGKTTTVRVLTGLLPPSGGSVKIMGFDIEKEASEAKESLGIVPEVSNTYLELTARENLYFMGRLYGMGKKKIKERSDELLDTFGIYEMADIKTRKLSKGLRQRVVLASALLHEPQLLFMDEPTSGLDVSSARLIRDILSELNRDGKTIFLMTHNIEEASRLCDRVAIINRGKIAAIDSPINLRNTIKETQSLEVVFGGGERQKLAGELNRHRDVNKVEVAGERIRIYTKNIEQLSFAVVDLARKNNLSIKSINSYAPSLEDVFVRLTEKGKSK